MCSGISQMAMCSVEIFGGFINGDHVEGGKCILYIFIVFSNLLGKSQYINVTQ